MNDNVLGWRSITSKQNRFQLTVKTTCQWSRDNKFVLDDDEDIENDDNNDNDEDH